MGSRQPALDHLAGIQQKMPTIRHLNGLGVRGSAASIFTKAVAGDDLEIVMVPKLG
jgi:hypothetical protein